ncbi:MAG: sugar kinase [Halieaceae bacterium]
MANSVALIGECMLELSRQPDMRPSGSLPMQLAYGGDTLNFAVYLARQGTAVDYVTALGDDPLSDWMVEQWQGEGVGCDFVQREPGAVPGMYLIETDDEGERSFFYWRDNAPARRLLDDEARARALFAALDDHAYLGLSGITLAILNDSSRQLLFELLSDYRSRGGKVVFDSNYRPALWPSVEATRSAYEAMYRLTDIALPTMEDEQAVFADDDQGELILRLQSWGVNEVVLKMGELGCLVSDSAGLELVPANVVTVVDTTSAGDSFNAGYLAARIQGKAPAEAAKAGHAVSSIVIQHRGAIIPVSAMPV